MAKSRAGGSAMYTSAPAGTMMALRPRKLGAYNRAAPSIRNATPATESANASASATYSIRSGPPTQLPTYIR